MTADLELVIETTSGVAKAQLQALRPKVLASYARYEPAIAGTAVCPPEGLTPLERQLMEKSYEALGRRASLKPIRAELLATSGEDGYCPMCGVDVATTLDHYAPKASYSEFAVLAVNLVPACATCNHLKRTNAAGVESIPFVHHFLHPFPAQPILVATIHVEDLALSVSYTLRCPDGDVSPFDFTSLEHQAAELRLLERIERAANAELVAASISSRVAFEMGGREQVIDLCARFATAFEARWGANNWKPALYRALADSDDFTHGRFAVDPGDGTL